MTLVATKALDPYINVSTSYSGDVQLSTYTAGDVAVALPQPGGTLSLLTFKANDQSAYPAMSVMIYDKLEEAIYPGDVTNVDQTLLAARLQVLAVAMGWNSANYTTNPWYGIDVMNHFCTEMAVLASDNPVPAGYSANAAFEALQQGYTTLNGMMGSSATYSEGHDGSNTDWFYYSPNFNQAGPQFFIGRIGAPTVYCVKMSPFEMATMPASSENFYDVRAGYMQPMWREKNLPVIFEPMSMSYFWTEIQTARAAFMLNNTNYFATL